MGEIAGDADFREMMEAHVEEMGGGAGAWQNDEQMIADDLLREQEAEMLFDIWD